MKFRVADFGTQVKHARQLLGFSIIQADGEDEACLPSLVWVLALGVQTSNGLADKELVMFGRGIAGRVRLSIRCMGAGIVTSRLVLVSSEHNIGSTGIWMKHVDVHLRWDWRYRA
jgi:hypothetical protein